MFDSMRARLTLWYTGRAAFGLKIFAVATYAYLARATRARTDQSLADTANSLISNFTAETDDEGQSTDDAASEVTRDFQFSDRQAVVFDEPGRMAATSDPPAVGGSTWPTTAVLSESLAELLRRSARAGRSYTTIPGEEGGVRAFAVPVKTRGRAYTFVIAQSLDEQNEELEQARSAFYIAIAAALALASVGGYFLARKSLAPVVEMGDRARLISATNLDERLPVPNPSDEFGRLAQIFNELLARLELSFEQQRRFMADASRELRTPVAIVCGESEVALSRESRVPEEYRESLSILHDEGRRLTRIVEDLFMLARADAGQYRGDFADLYLEEAVGECVRAVRSLAVQRGVELQYVHPKDELLFRGDEELIRRMVLNLLDNAIKYTPPGGHVRVELMRDAAEYRISVSDTGAGIPAEAQRHIFERFYRVDKARSRNGETRGSAGAGLGLSIAAWVGELHGGSVRLERSDRSGSTFVVSLPVHSVNADARRTNGL